MHIVISRNSENNNIYKIENGRCLFKAFCKRIMTQLKLETR